MSPTAAASGQAGGSSAKSTYLPLLIMPAKLLTVLPQLHWAYLLGGIHQLPPPPARASLSTISCQASIFMPSPAGLFSDHQAQQACCRQRACHIALPSLVIPLCPKIYPLIDSPLFLPFSITHFYIYMHI